MEELKRQARACTERARTLAGDPLFAKRPAAGWSAAECVDHLSQTSGQLLPPVEAAVLHTGAGGPHYRMGWKERLLVWLMEPPYRMKAATREGFVPAVGDPAAVLPEFERWQERLERALDQARGKALDQVQIQSPFEARIHYSAWAAFNILLAHQRRHLWQADNVLSRLRV